MWVTWTSLIISVKIWSTFGFHFYYHLSFLDWNLLKPLNMNWFRSYDHLIILNQDLCKLSLGPLLKGIIHFFIWPHQSTCFYQWSLFQRHVAIMIIHHKQNKQDVRLEIKYWQQSSKFAEDEWAFPRLLWSPMCQNKQQQNTHIQHKRAFFLNFHIMKSKIITLFLWV